METIANIAGYKFVELTNLPEIRADLLNFAKRCGLKGTVLLAPEGINAMLAGEKQAIEEFTYFLRNITPFADIEFKKSYSASIPFKRLLVKIKKEIITFSVPKISPHQLTGKKLSPKEFKQWLDAGNELVVLDARNRFEIAVGGFTRAIDLGIDHFRSFPKAVQKLSSEFKQEPIVLYCTGGIRCEKASAFMMQQGFANVYQLEGGILKYFEECGGAHYTGKCFVFDERIALDPSFR